MDTVRVDLANRSYDIYIGQGLLKHLAQYLQRQIQWIIITDTNLDKIYGEEILRELGDKKIYKYVIKAGEESKQIDTVMNIAAYMVDHGFTRKDGIVAFGGGVVGDLAGFCASIYMRGIPFIQIPTTLLAQVDSSVGGKTGVNLPQAKNIIGSFHQPDLVIVDTEVLDTLPSRELISGLGEVIKYGIIQDYRFFQYVKENMVNIMNREKQILQNVIKRCCEIKADVISKDEKEMGLRKYLNFGHTIGHGLEAQTAYEKYTHGEAVFIGMYYEAMMAERLGLIDLDYFQEIADCIRAVGISLNITMYPKEKLVDIMKKDKKNEDHKISFILPVGKGKVKEYLFSKNEVFNLLSAIDDSI